jgi:hypothetical protein
MINSDPPPNASGASEEEAVDAIVQAGPGGAMWLAGLATAAVVAIWFAFYWMVFLPRVTPP